MEEIKKIMTKQEYDLVKTKLKDLSTEYKTHIDEVLVASHLLAVIRAQINSCLEFVAFYEQQENPLEQNGDKMD